MESGRDKYVCWDRRKGKCGLEYIFYEKYKNKKEVKVGEVDWGMVRNSLVSYF